MARKLTTRRSWQGARGAERLLSLLLQARKRHNTITGTPDFTSTTTAIGRHTMSRVLYAREYCTPTGSVYRLPLLAHSRQDTSNRQRPVATLVSKPKLRLVEDPVWTKTALHWQRVGWKLQSQWMQSTVSGVSSKSAPINKADISQLWTCPHKRWASRNSVREVQPKRKKNSDSFMMVEMSATQQYPLQ